MPFACVLSTEATPGAALTDCLARTNWQGPVDLAMVFYAPAHGAKAVNIAQAISAVLQPRCLIGCQGETVIGNDREIEDGPALCLWLGRWNEEVELTPFHLGAVSRPRRGHCG